MSKLRDLQCAVGRGILCHDQGSIVEAILGDGLDPAARLQIYANHYRSSLTEALKAIYPVVCRLVDERFFGFAADRYIDSSPPRKPCLFEFGETFADFLAGFPPCRTLPYLPDVARLEWAINAALHSPAEAPLEAGAFAAVTPADYPRLVFRLQPSLRLIASPWPVDLIWQANQPGAEDSVDLDQGACRLEIRQLGEEVVFRRLEPAEFDLRGFLAVGRPLEAALAAVLETDRLFDPAMALSRLFGEGLVTGYAFAAIEIPQSTEALP
jgi:Putative DNA-binding domain